MQYFKTQKRATGLFHNGYKYSINNRQNVLEIPWQKISWIANSWGLNRKDSRPSNPSNWVQKEKKNG